MEVRVIQFCCISYFVGRDNDGVSIVHRHELSEISAPGVWE